MNLSPSHWYRKIKRRLFEDDPRKDVAIQPLPPVRDDYAFAVPFLNTLPPHGITRVAVIAHVFYPDICPELINAIGHIPAQADLYISTDTEEKRAQIKEVVAHYAKGSVEIRVVPNRGRDIAPKIIGFADVYERYEYFLHIHTKKTLFNDALSGWRPYLYHNLVGSPEIVNSIFTLLQREEIGAVFPQHFPIVRQSVHWGYCFRRSREMLAKVGITLRRSMPLDFPSGSMFWGKTRAFRYLLDCQLQLSDFEEESGQIDGTMAHVVEHSFLHFVEGAGYGWAKVGSEATYPHPETLLPVICERDISSHLERVYRPLLIESPAPNVPLRHMDVREVTEIEYKLAKSPGELSGKDVVLFVTYHPTGFKSRHVNRLISAFHAAQIKVLLISVVDSLEKIIVDPSPEVVEGHVIRTNHGYDFSAWAHVLKIFPQLYAARTLYFANDSIFGPLNDKAFDRIIEKIFTSKADLVALTDSYEITHHYQTYFFALRNRAETFSKIKVFWDKVRSIPNKQLVISQYELALKSQALGSRIRCQALFPTSKFRRTKLTTNPTLVLWKDLIRRGFPFVKVQLIRDSPDGTNTDGLEAILHQRGYDFTIVDEHLTTPKA